MKRNIGEKEKICRKKEEMEGDGDVGYLLM